MKFTLQNILSEIQRKEAEIATETYHMIDTETLSKLKPVASSTLAAAEV